MTPRSFAALAVMFPLVAAAPAQQSRRVDPPGNPLLADGRDYSADPAPFVADGRLWILAGRDEAPPEVNDFVMREWQLLSTTDPASGRWTHDRAVARPRAVFAWADADHAYAGHIVQGADGRYYLYAPVAERGSPAAERSAIGVAVADAPTGPWRDAHPSGPIVSQRVPVANDIMNIDPSVMVDDDGRVYMVWGTFGQLRGIELERDMVTVKGEERRLQADAFFEAPWLMKRNGTYYLLYAGNKDPGPGSPCGPALYHACINYATAAGPWGPWTYRGVILRPVSSASSHAGAVAFRGRWYLAYHTADARGGGHYRRSVAVDRLEWDDTVSPAAIRPVVQTRRAAPPPQAMRNIAAAAVAVASRPVPVQYWIAALNDGKVKENPLPPQIWSNWGPPHPARTWLEYRWDRPVTIDGARIHFWADHAAGSDEGVAPPAAWHLEYWAGGWKPIARSRGYGTAAGRFATARFAPVATRCLRLVMEASGSAKEHAALGVQEWEVLAPVAAVARPAPAVSPPPCG